MFKKIASAAAAVLTIATIGAMTFFTANAGPPSNSAWVTLYPNQTYSQTKKVYGGYKYFGGKNYASSKHRVYFDVHYIGSDGKNITDKTYLMGANQVLNETKTNTRANGNWYLELNPFMIGSRNCSANGYIWYS